MRIYVKGISCNTDSDGLRELFALVGEVTTARVVQDMNSGQSNGYGFVEMSNTEEAKQAIAQFDGCNTDGRPLTVSEAEPRQE